MRRLWLTGTSEIEGQRQHPKPSSRAFFRPTKPPPGCWAQRPEPSVALRPVTIGPQTWREPLIHWTVLAAAGVITVAALVPAKAADISGAGATFPYPVYAKWADAYKKVTGNGMNYQSIGSGGGIKQIKAKTVTFGATDAPLPGKELDESVLAQFPMVMGGIVPF